MRRVLSAGCDAAEADAPRLCVGGLERLSVVDWPGQLAAVVFCQGCDWRCRYCHNPHLRSRARSGALDWADVLAWLERRRGLLDAVVFSGGEPTLQPGLSAAMREARALDFKIGLHTAGPEPRRLHPLLPLLDWVGFDFKAPFARYAAVTGRPGGERARECFELLRAAEIPCEVRTTWHPRLLSATDLRDMAGTLAAAGCADWVIQPFRPHGCPDAELRAAPTGAVPVGAIGVPGLNIRVR